MINISLNNVNTNEVALQIKINHTLTSAKTTLSDLLKNTFIGNIKDLEKIKDDILIQIENELDEALNSALLKGLTNINICIKK